MQSKGIQPDEYTFGALISSYAQNTTSKKEKYNYMDKAYGLYNMAEEHGFGSSTAICNALLKVCLKWGTAEDVNRIFNLHFKLDLISLTTAIQFCADKKFPFSAATRFADILISEKIKPDADFLGALLRALRASVDITMDSNVSERRALIDQVERVRKFTPDLDFDADCLAEVLRHYRDMGFPHDGLKKLDQFKGAITPKLHCIKLSLMLNAKISDGVDEAFEDAIKTGELNIELINTMLEYCVFLKKYDKFERIFYQLFDFKNVKSIEKAFNYKLPKMKMNNKTVYSFLRYALLTKMELKHIKRFISFIGPKKAEAIRPNLIERINLLVK